MGEGEGPSFRFLTANPPPTPHRFDLASGILPLTCGNFTGRLSNLTVGCVERIEKGVGVLMSTVDSLAPGADRELRREVNVSKQDLAANADAEAEEEEYERMSGFHYVVDSGNARVADSDGDRFREGEAMCMSFAPRGVVAMVRETKAGTSTTKFLVTTEDGGAKHLQGGGVVFGKVRGDDMKVLDELMGEFTMRGVPGKKINIVGANVEFTG